MMMLIELTTMLHQADVILNANVTHQTDFHHMWHIIRIQGHISFEGGDVTSVTVVDEVACVNVNSGQ